MRKGPEHIPDSWLLLVTATVMLIVASFVAMVLIEPIAQQDVHVTFLTNALGLASYGAVLFVTGYPGRIVVALTSVIGCTAILTCIFVAEFVLFRPFVGVDVAGTVAALIVLWSVPVEGHIISRSIQQHWFVGIAIAIAVFILQLGFQSALEGRN